ncbi:restriction endonuclease subunit S [Catellatospora citrea]|uniref:restriction endonuclease subunit S n=1 Tax=Catellatospora citrea TaxID=53366 RepID=UPI0033C0BECE
MSFAQTRLKYVCRLVAGGTPSVADEANWADDSGHAWVSISDMSSVERVSETGRRITDAGVRDARLVLGPPGTLLFSMYASLGHTAVLDVRAAWNQALLGLLPRCDIDMRFIRYSLVQLKPQLAELARSNTQANLNAEQVGNLPIPLPSIEEQRRIADFLDAETARLDGLLELRRRQVALLAELWQAAIDEIIASHQHSVELRRLGVRVTTGPFGSVFAASEYESGGIPMINPTHIRQGRLLPDPHHAVSAATAARLSRHRLCEGDLVVGRKGDIGRSAEVLAEQSGWICGSDAIALHTQGSRVLARFLSYLLRSDSVRTQLLERSIGATMPSLNEGNLLQLRIPTMDAAEQADAAARLAQWESGISGCRTAMQRQAELFAERRQALITAAVTGQLDVSTARGADLS